MGEGDRAPAGVAEPVTHLDVDARPMDPDAEREWVASLDEQLRQHRPAALGALLTGTALLRVATVGTGVAIQFDLSDLAGGRPNAVAVGLVGAAQALTEMIFAPFLARWADRHGRRRFLVGGPLIGLAGVLLVAAGLSPVQLASARLVEGIGAAAFIPVALGTIAAATVRNRSVRSQASGAFEGATLAGYAGGFALSSLLWPALHRGSFLVLGVLYLAAALVCLRFVPNLPPLRVSPLRNVLRAVIGPGPLRSFMPAWICGFALLGAFIANLAALLRHQRVPGQTLMHHFDERLIGAILIGWIIVFVAGIVLWTPFLSRSRPISIMRRAVPGAWLVLLALFCINHAAIGLAPVFLPMLILGILWLAGFGPAAVTFLADCSEAYAADRAALMSFYTVALAGGGAVGAVLGGVFTRLFQADGLLLLGLLLSLITFTLLIVVARRESAPALQPA